MTRKQLIEVLGEPDAKGGMSRKYPEPSVYLYGDVEFWFLQEKDAECFEIKVKENYHVS